MTAATTTAPRGTTGDKVPLTRSTFWLVVTSAVTTLLCLGAGLPSLVVGLVAVARNSSDHASAKRLTTIGWWVFTACLAAMLVGLLAVASTTAAFEEFWDWEAAGEVLPQLVESFVTVTLVVTVLGSIIAALLGLVLAVLLTALPSVVGKALRLLMDFVRMTPLVIQLVFVYNLVPGAWNEQMMWIGTVVFGVHYATYMAESYLSGIASVDKGQWEAATALSLPQARTWTGVVLPQAIRATLPSLGNWAIAMFKETPFLIVISVTEMVTEAQRYGGNTFRFTEAFTLAGLIFLVASLLTAFAVRRLEKSLVY